MDRLEIRRLFEQAETWAGQETVVCGWVKTIRNSKSVGFIELNDGSCFRGLQVVFEEGGIGNYKQIVKQNVGAALVVRGTVILTPDRSQPLEVHALDIQVEGESAADYPLQKKRHSLEFLRTIAHLRPRANTMSAVFRVRGATAYAIHKFFNEAGFVYVHTPIITGSDAEGAGEMFRVTTLDGKNPLLNDRGEIDYGKDFFGRRTQLTVSGQLQAECMALAFGKVYTFGPTFRAENSNTPRHAAEFWMIEPEIAFADLGDDMRLAQDMLQYVLRHVLEHCPEEMRFFNDFYDKNLVERLWGIVNAEFAHISYTDAVVLLEERNRQAAFEYPVSWGVDLQTEHERYLTEQVFGKPVFVTDYPKDIKAFYMRMNDDGKTVAAMDLLAPGVGEIIGGSQREERLDVLKARMAGMGLTEDSYRWYLQLRQYGGARHAGFGLGFERLLMYITGVSNIRDVLPFPRTVGAAEF
jgi:asparaginyl-tRNA synthetase